MIIAVVAADGRTGRQFVTAALARGHTIHAGIRGENPFLDQENVTVFECDATEIKQVRNLVRGCDAVVSLIGHVKNSPAIVQTEAIRSIVEA